MTNTKNQRFEVSFESATDSGNRLIYATTHEEALTKFCERYEERGIEAPNCWISGQWGVE